MSSEGRRFDLRGLIRKTREEDRRGEARDRLTLFKCACVRMTRAGMATSSVDELRALEATELNVLGRISRADYLDAVNHRFAGGMTVVIGLNAESPGAASAVAVEAAVQNSDERSVETVLTMCLAWAQFTAKRYGEDSSRARGEMEERMLDALERILAAATLEGAVAECR